MTYIVEYANPLLVLVGLLGLFLGGEALIRGAVAIADRVRLPKLLVGLTIVGFGTSMPELLVCLKAVQTGAPAVAVGNVVGSNIANILLIACVGALIRPLPTQDGGVRRDATIMFLVTAGFAWLAWQGRIGRQDGLVMAGALCMYVLAAFVLDRRRQATDAPPARLLSVSSALLLFAGGLAGLIFGADALVRGATAIATDLGVPEAVIGLTLVAVGTSLPELTVSVLSAIRGQNALALGNVIGSNIFNILAVLGVTASISPVTIAPTFLSVDIPLMAGAAAGLWLIVIRSPKLGRLPALFGLTLYAGYMGWLALSALPLSFR